MKHNIHYISEKNRLETFKNWVYSNEDQCSAQKMAEAGFLFIGSKSEPDLVLCFFCNKELDGWEKDDDPWKEHINHARHCKFAAGRTPEDEMTVSQFLDIVNAYGEKLIEDFFDRKLNSLDKNFEIVLDYFSAKN